MRAIFSRLDNFIAMFVAVFGVIWSTVFMPLLGGPLHSYEADAIGAGWRSIRSGQAQSLSDAFEAATSLPAQAVFPSAHAEELPMQLTAEADPRTLDLLGAPEIEIGPAVLLSARSDASRASTRAPRLSVSVAPLADIDAVPEATCDITAIEQELCEVPRAAASAVAANT